MTADLPEVNSSSSSRVRLTGLSPAAYRHDLDQQTAETLRKVPGFEKAMAALSRYSFEKFLHHECCASAVRVTARQCAGIHDLLLEACAILDMPEPSLFLSQTPVANAFAFGRDEPTVVLQTGLVELLNEQELLAVLAHELGHIQCGHSLYRLAALILVLVSKYGGSSLGVGEIFSLSLQLALLEWARNAEFSADRAATLVVQDPEVVFSALFKLTGGSPKIFAQMDRDEYLRQADAYERPDVGRLDKFYRLLVESSVDHPIPVLRARETLRWGTSDEYRAILAGEYPRRALTTAPKLQAPSLPRSCQNCGAAVDSGFSFCTDCGQSLREGNVGDE